MISVIIRVGLDDSSQTSQGSNIRRKESLDNIRSSIKNMEEKRNMLNIEKIRSLEETWSMNNREEMKSFRNMEQNTRIIEKLEDSLVRPDTGDSQRTEDYFFMQGSCQGSPPKSDMPHPPRPRTRSIMDKIEYKIKIKI